MGDLLGILPDLTGAILSHVNLPLLSPGQLSSHDSTAINTKSMAGVLDTTWDKPGTS